MCDCKDCFFYDDRLSCCCLGDNCDDTAIAPAKYDCDTVKSSYDDFLDAITNDYVDCSDDDLIDAAEAAFDDYLAECTADYSELCSVRAQHRG